MTRRLGGFNRVKRYVVVYLMKKKKRFKKKEVKLDIFSLCGLSFGLIIWSLWSYLTTRAHLRLIVGQFIWPSWHEYLAQVVRPILWPFFGSLLLKGHLRLPLPIASGCYQFRQFFRPPTPVTVSS